MENSIIKINQLLDINNFSKEEKDYFWKIITPIFYHPEFQKRLDNKLYPHHGTVSVGTHILHDAIITYKLSLKENGKNKNLNIRLAILIAMFHDLYELPWQNSPIKKEKFINKHGFVHSIEAIINSINWFPQYFENIEDAKIIIDGVIHHMWPFPLRAIDFNIYNTEINNLEKAQFVPKHLQQLIISSSCRLKFFHISLSKSKFREGKVMSKADKIITIKKELTHFNSYKSLITGNNPDLYKN